LSVSQEQKAETENKHDKKNTHASKVHFSSFINYLFNLRQGKWTTYLYILLEDAAAIL
jgi:hypothetical protein